MLGEEGGVAGNVASDYLWLIDPIDGTVNFAHGMGRMSSLTWVTLVSSTYLT